VATALGIEFASVDLGPAAEAIAGALGAAAERVRFGNILARLRMIALFDRARTVPALVLGTSNKSEILLGYSTLFGDSASSVNPLGDVWKTHVYRLADQLQLPSFLLHKPPSADLWPGQTDARELGFDYAEADPVLYWHHEQGLDRDQLAAAGFPVELVDRILLAYRRSRFKWRPTVVARTSPSCINVDRILPRNPEK
jgi:NAD+ synthase